MYKSVLRPILFRFDAEKVHYFVVNLLKFFCQIPFAKKLLQALYSVENPKLQRKIMGLTFKNPVGLAAGFDKNAETIDEMEALGFGFVEIGTLTPKAQDGNPKPRLFRLLADSAIINRMGFNNKGVEAATILLAKRKSKIIVGGNIGKNKITPNENAVDDYCLCFEALYDVVDYFVVNVSSPNTPNLRDLQEKEPLTKLLQTLQTKNVEKTKNHNKTHQTNSPSKPILLKIAPDLTDSQLNDIVEIVQTTKIQGIIATNTTIDRSNLLTSLAELDAIGAGGLSGKPLNARATTVIRYLRQRLGKDIVIIGVGGIFSAEDALEKLEAGADLIQLYTGFIYEGAALVKDINQKTLQKIIA
jgi:dihydroorotate dehydrogenase